MLVGPSFGRLLRSSALIGAPVFVWTLVRGRWGSVARLEAERLAIGYGGVAVGRGLDVSGGTGDVLCLLGPNGRGKTTLFRTRLGLIPHLGGRLALGGAPLADLFRAEIARRGAYVPQRRLRS